MSTAVTLAMLALVLRYLPPGARNTRANVSPEAMQVAPAELQLSGLQVRQAGGGDALYLDGLVTNVGKALVTGATAEVNFRDAEGQVIVSMQKPLAGPADGETDRDRDPFARNPITPNERRFFRVAVEQVPPGWNHALPTLKIVAVNGR